jgi:hypothetical protein
MIPMLLEFLFWFGRAFYRDSFPALLVYTFNISLLATTMTFQKDFFSVWIDST